MAWLHATPEGSKKSRLTSLKELDEDSSFLKLPKIEGAEYLVALLFEAGLLESTGMGATALSWSEIESWLRCTSLELSNWEKLMIKTMSDVYVSEYNQSSAKDRAAPYIYVDEVQVKRDEVANKLLNVLRSFKRTSVEPEENKD